MTKRLLRVALVLMAAAATSWLWAAAPSDKRIPAGAGDRLAPLAVQSQAASSHAPYEEGDCSICHQSNDPRKPGPMKKEVQQLCLGCHEDFTASLRQKYTHKPAREACTSCHNPHNAAQSKLLLAEPVALCNGCHEEVKRLTESAPVKHAGALARGARCSNCHDPHGSAVERLLIALPFDLCVKCHSTDTLAGADGRKLQNIKAWIEANPVLHGPVETKDCGDCHQPHGSANFRLLEKYYPPDFYAPYDKRNYAMCFSCHSERAFSTAETTTLTKFRDGARNLHYLHVQQGNRGRTCRACHDVHATRQQHLVRDGVPYGSGGWVLKLNYRKTETGGSCAKTCHQEKGYANRPAR